MLRRHDADDNLRARERSAQVAGCDNRFRKPEPGQKAFVDPASANAFGNFRFVSPEAHVVLKIRRSLAPKDHCQRRAPGACSNHGDSGRGSCHCGLAPKVPGFVADFPPSFDSVPPAIRPMYCRCLQMTNAETSAININCRESAYS